MADASNPMNVRVQIFTWQVVTIIGMLIGACTTLMILRLISVAWLERGLEMLGLGAVTYVIGLLKQSPIDQAAQRGYTQGKKDSMRPPPLETPPADKLPPVTKIQIRRDDK